MTYSRTIYTGAPLAPLARQAVQQMALRINSLRRWSDHPGPPWTAPGAGRALVLHSITLAT